MDTSLNIERDLKTKCIQEGSRFRSRFNIRFSLDSCLKI